MSDSEDDGDYQPEEGNSEAEDEVVTRGSKRKLAQVNEEEEAKSLKEEEERKKKEEEEKKKKVDDLWESLNKRPARRKSSTAALSTPPASESISTPSPAPTTENKETTKSKLANDSLKDIMASLLPPAAPKKQTITETYNFAGEDIVVTKEVKDTDQPPKTGAVKKGDLQALVANLTGKKKKMSTMTKSQLDWDKFKETEGKEFEHELEQHKKDGYLEKVAFLQQADLKKYEQERDLRLKKRKVSNSGGGGID